MSTITTMVDDWNYTGGSTVTYSSADWSNHIYDATASSLVLGGTSNTMYYTVSSNVYSNNIRIHVRNEFPSIITSSAVEESSIFTMSSTMNIATLDYVLEIPVEVVEDHMGGHIKNLEAIKNCFVFMNGEHISFNEEFVTENLIKDREYNIKRENWIKTLRQKRFEIHIKKAENRGLTLLEKLIDEKQMQNYLEKGFVEIFDANGNLCKVFKNDSTQIQVFERKKNQIFTGLTTAKLMEKADEFQINGETFVLKKKLCTQHKTQKMPDVDGVISKILHLRAVPDYKQFANVFAA